MFCLKWTNVASASCILYIFLCSSPHVCSRSSAFTFSLSLSFCVFSRIAKNYSDNCLMSSRCLKFKNSTPQQIQVGERFTSLPVTALSFNLNMYQTINMNSKTCIFFNREKPVRTLLFQLVLIKQRRKSTMERWTSSRFVLKLPRSPGSTEEIRTRCTHRLKCLLSV